jgi:hypothetical protein
LTVTGCARVSTIVTAQRASLGIGRRQAGALRIVVHLGKMRRDFIDDLRLAAKPQFRNLRPDVMPEIHDLPGWIDGDAMPKSSRQRPRWSASTLRPLVISR